MSLDVHLEVVVDFDNSFTKKKEINTIQIGDFRHLWHIVDFALKEIGYSDSLPIEESEYTPPLYIKGDNIKKLKEWAFDVKYDGYHVEEGYFEEKIVELITALEVFDFLKKQNSFANVYLKLWWSN